MRTRPIPDKLFKYRSLAGDNFRYTQEIFTRNELHCSSLRAFNDPFEGRFALVMPPHAPESLRMHQRWLNDMSNMIVQDSAAVCAFSEKRDDIVMWAHYADSHHGICLEFSPPRYGKMRRDLYDVRYISSFKEVQEGTYSDTDALMRLVCTAKSKHWEYESEWRVVSTTPGPYKFHSRALTGVILGCRVSGEHEQWVKAWISKRKPRPRLYRASPSPDQLTLYISE